MSKYQIVWKNPRYAMEISKPCTLLAINRIKEKIKEKGHILNFKYFISDIIYFITF